MEWHQKGCPANQSPSLTSVAYIEELVMKVKTMEALLTNTFACVSSLKNAYAQLQSAHSPYRPDKLHSADMAVVLEFKKLSELKHRYITAIRKKEDEEFEKEQCKAYKQALRGIKEQVKQKGEELKEMVEAVEELALRKEKLGRRVSNLERKSMRSQELSLTLDLFKCAITGAKNAAISFTKLLTKHMESAKWDLDEAAKSIEPGISYAKPSHKKFAFQSYACLRMFNGFENENFFLSCSLSSIMDPAKQRAECFRQFQDMQYMDPLELVSITPECWFGKFCHKKYLCIVHPKMEESFFGSYEHRNQILSGMHPRSYFYEIFLRFAKAVWLVHKLAFAFDPVASIFQVKRGEDFVAACMESVVENVEIDVETHNLVPKVGFAVVPGFRLGESTIKCEVYLDRMKATK